MTDTQLRKAQGVPPRPPDDEFERRIERVYDVLDEHGVDGVVVYGTGSTPDPIRYLTGYVHVFPRGGLKSSVIRSPTSKSFDVLVWAIASVPPCIWTVISL